MVFLKNIDKGKYLVCLYLILIPNLFNSQIINSEKFSGIIRIKNDSESYPIEITFNTDSIGDIKGYSIFNPNKSSETKTLFSGSYKKNVLEFKEYKIISTQSLGALNNMCFIHYRGKTKKVLNSEMISGDFQGFFKDGKKCAEGSINFLAKEKFYQKLDSLKTEKKIKYVADSNISINNFINSIPIVKKDNSSTIINWTSDTLEFRIWDNDKVDHDQISITINNEIVETKLNLSKNGYVYKKPISSNSKIIIKAVNVGFFPPNTSSISFLDGIKRLNFINNLSKSSYLEYIISK